jgi:REP element-mobilizing transposase RayT
VRNKHLAVRSEKAKEIFWDRFWFYVKKYNLYVWIVTLMDNHYHVIVHVQDKEVMPEFMQRLHGSVAKLVNDVLPERHLPFWRTKGSRDYYDGCLRNEKQVRRAYKYTLKQAVRAGVVRDWRKYNHTKVLIHLGRGIKRAHELKSIPIEVPYERYRREGRDQ